MVCCTKWLGMTDNRDEFKKYGLKTPEWTLNGQKMWARIVDVYDGDTLTLILKLSTGFYKFSCRVYGIDTAEIKSKMIENKNSSQKARNRMLQLCGIPDIDINNLYKRKEIQMLLNEDIYMIWIECGDFDKYGRLLITPYKNSNDKIHLGKILIEENLAYEYLGGKKLTELEQSEILEK